MVFAGLNSVPGLSDCSSVPHITTRVTEWAFCAAVRMLRSISQVGMIMSVEGQRLPHLKSSWPKDTVLPVVIKASNWCGTMDDSTGRCDSRIESGLHSHVGNCSKLETAGGDLLWVSLVEEWDVLCGIAHHNINNVRCGR